MASNSLPETGYVRLPTILRVFPVSRSTWWQWVKDGKAPAGTKLGPRITAWRVEDIQALIASHSK
jgi:predicted DNA-binding transcriptional regulator AlpA